MKIDGSTALVTGAGRRVGRAIALGLSRHGARVGVHYHRSAQAARALASAISAEGGRAELFKADLSKPAQVRRLAGQALKRFGRLDILVNSASIYERNAFGRATAGDFDRHMAINLRAPMLLSQDLGKAMIKSGGGSIINIADWSGTRPYVDRIPYCLSKAGLLCLNTALAKALAPSVRVNAILPGPVLMPDRSSRKLRRAAARATLLRRLGKPEDVVEAVVFLVEGSDFVTGAALPVDGGRLVR